MSLGTSGTIFAVSERRTADPTGVVAGFADATGRFLPLACTLNCTLAVDRTAAWLGLDRDDVAPAGSVVVYPYLDGERTPDLPGAAGTMLGLRHTSTPQQVLHGHLRGRRRGAARGARRDRGRGRRARRRRAADAGRRRGARTDLGRGRPPALRAAGAIPTPTNWSPSGRRSQATAAWRDEDPAAIARRWGTAAGTLLDPLPRDDARLERIAAFRGAIELAAAVPAHGS